MPKRAVTPPPADDEPEFLTVVHPYPLRANPELAGDRKSIVFWLACIAEGHSHLLNIYHKPTSPGMIILEVNKEFDRFEDLLGLHEWSKILKKPDAEEVQCNSKIFYSLYKSARQVTKLGWKQVVIDDSWFVNWSANNTFIQYPYPKSTWCDVPLENKTLAPLCRPLPVIHFPPPPVAVPPPVGSAEWNKLKAEGRLPNAPSKHKGKAPGGAWAKGASTSRAPTSKTASGSRVSQPTREIPPPIIPVTSRPSQAPSIPPGLGIRSNSNALPSMPGLSPGNSGSSSDDSRVLTPDSGLHAPAGGRFNWAEDVENESAYGATSFPGPAGTVHGNLEYAPGPQSFDDSHDDEDHQLPTIHAVDQSEPIPVSDSKNLWADYIEPKEDKILPWKHVCSVHGELCPGKVCKEYTKKLREEKRKEEQAKWDAERRQQRAKKSRQAPQKMTEKEYWARGPAPGPGTAAPKSNSSSTPSSGSSSGVPSRASSRTPSTGPRAPSPAVPPPAPPAQQTSNDPWDNDGQMSSWDADETRSMASTARTGWGDDAASVANDDDGRSVASTRDEWHVSESSTPWDNAPPRPANNAPPASRGTGAWGAPKPAPSSGWGASAAGNNRRGAAASRGNGGRATVHTQQQRSNGWATVQKPAPANLRANQPQTRGRPPQGAGRGSRGGGQAWGPTRSNVTSTANASVPAAADAASEDGWGNVSSSSHIW